MGVRKLQYTTDCRYIIKIGYYIVVPKKFKSIGIEKMRVQQFLKNCNLNNHSLITKE